MGRYLVKIDELEEKNKYLEDVISDIKERVNNINYIKDDVRWISYSKEKLMERYDEYVAFLNKMVHDLETCLSVNNKFLYNYSDGYQSIKKDFSEISKEVEKSVL